MTISQNKYLRGNYVKEEEYQEYLAVGWESRKRKKFTCTPMNCSLDIDNNEGLDDDNKVQNDLL